MASADLILDPPKPTADAHIELGARLVEDTGTTRRLWFRFPAAYTPLLTSRADPFVIAIIVYAIGRIEKLHVRGAVSDGLFANLTDFQAAFLAFQHRSAAPVEFSADETAPVERRSPASTAITAFSGGVDSCFSVYRHTALSSLAPKRTLHAALMMHGFDIPLADRTTFARSAARSKQLTDDAGVELFNGATNLRELPVPWEETFAAAVAASLSFFQPVHALGLVPSCHDWRHTHFENGSNPVTDPLLSSLSFQIIHDGTGYGRIDKLRHLGQWPEAMRSLRVCWQGEALDRNCGRCEKCLRTMLMLRLCGIPDAPAFPADLDLVALDRLVIRSQGGRDEFAYLLSEARRAGLNEPWIKPAARALRRSRRNVFLWRQGRSIAAWLPRPAREWLGAGARRWLLKARAAKPADQTATRVAPSASTASS